MGRDIKLLISNMKQPLFWMNVMKRVRLFRKEAGHTHSRLRDTLGLLKGLKIHLTHRNKNEDAQTKENARLKQENKQLNDEVERSQGTALTWSFRSIKQKKNGIQLLKYQGICPTCFKCIALPPYVPVRQRRSPHKRLSQHVPLTVSESKMKQRRRDQWHRNIALLRRCRCGTKYTAKGRRGGAWQGCKPS